MLNDAVSIIGCSSNSITTAALSRPRKIKTVFAYYWRVLFLHYLLIDESVVFLQQQTRFFHSPISQRQPPQGHISDWLRGTYSSLIIMGEVFPRIIRSGPPLPVSFTTPPVELTIYWKIQERRQLRRMEQYTRVELVTQPWQGRVLPLN